MSYVTPIDPPLDYPERVKSVRDLKGLTQAQLAELIGVSFASVNRWENGQSRPNSLSWRRILEIESSIAGDDGDTLPIVAEGLSTAPGPGLLLPTRTLFGLLQKPIVSPMGISSIRRSQAKHL